MASTASTAWTKRLNQVMPWGSSTISKAPNLTPDEPGVIVRGKGCRVWDADGRQYIDFRNALGPVTLGYGFEAVDDAIREQLDHGIVFGHPHPIECEVAEMICDVVPCADQARFLKTGGEAVAATIRLARYHTGRKHVIQIGYNGWLNSLTAGDPTRLGHTMDSGPPGTPASISVLHHTCRWNDLAQMEEIFNQFHKQIAAVVVAADYENMPAGHSFYPAVRQLTQRHGALLIFDEIVTGFRIAIGGAQEYFGVTPDMAVFAKGLANGMPLSVYAGRRELMNDFQKVVVSSTYGGETLSLAAARATIETYQHHDVIGHLRNQGKALATGANEIFQRRGLPIQLRGMDSSPIFCYENVEPTVQATLQEQFFRSAYQHGLSFYDLAYMSFSHEDADIVEALQRLDACCDDLVATTTAVKD